MSASDDIYFVTLGASTYPLRALRALLKSEQGAVYAVGSLVAYLRDLCSLRLYPQPLSAQQVEIVERMMWHPSANTLISNQLLWPLLTVQDERGGVRGYLTSAVEGDPLSRRALNARDRRFEGWTRLTLCRAARRWLSQCTYLDRAGLSLLHAAQGELYLSPEEPGLVYTLCALVEEGAPRGLGAVAEVLFELLMLGRGPALKQGGGLPYGYAERATRVKEGEALSCWRALSVGLHSLAERSFERGEEIELAEWDDALAEYAAGLEEGVYPLGLSGELVTLHRAPIRIDDGRKRGTGDPLNIITHGPLYERFGLIELSTRAVKWMSVELGALWAGWSWSAFKNNAALTSTGQLLSAEDHTLDIKRFRDRVLPHIHTARRALVERGVNRIYVIATAVYRSAENRDDVLALIREEVGLSVQILDRNQEARETFLAYQWIEGGLKRDTLLIDQGGGSTEMSYFSAEGLLLERAHLTLGTEAALNMLLSAATPSSSLSAALDETRRLLRERVNEATRVLRALIVERGQLFEVVGLGSAITKATRKTSNAAQHGVTLSAPQLVSFLNERRARLEGSGLQTLGELHHRVHEALLGRTQSATHEALVHLLGVELFLLLLARFEASAVRVSGVALRYGFLRSRLMEAVRADYGVEFGVGEPLFEIPEGPVPRNEFRARSRAPRLDLSALGVREGETFSSGRVKAVVPFGVFVHLTPQLDGLLHVSVLGSRPLSSFVVGAELAVRVREVREDHKRPGRARVALELDGETTSPPAVGGGADERAEAKKKG